MNGAGTTEPPSPADPILVRSAAPSRASAGVVAGFVGRRGGVSRGPFSSLNVGYDVGDDVESVTENRSRLARCLRLEVQLETARQVHGCGVRVVDGSEAKGSRQEAADALVTDSPARALLVTAADCPVVVLVHRQRPLAALVHAGWRGIVAGVIEAALATIRHRFDSGPDALDAFITPCIGRCCYEVGPDLVERLPPRDRAFLVRRSPRPHLDLPALVEDRLRRAGLASGALDVDPHCTCCRNDLYFSHRRQGGCSGRNGVVVWVPRRD
ncbi:MAG: peptidoglycan editing factor PgeF [Planctomycetota bacterium]